MFGVNIKAARGAGYLVKLSAYGNPGLMHSKKHSYAVPKRFSPSRVPSLVQKNSQWIERAFQKAKAFQGLIGPMADWQMPEQVTRNIAHNSCNARRNQ
jgi:hypothetical protein